MENIKSIQNSKRKIQNFKRKGFSIGEVMLAGFVLSVALVATIELVSSSLKHSMDSRDHIIASELAQEGLELVRNKRDNNIASGASQFDGINSGSSCRVGYNVNTINCSSSSFGLNYYNNFYEHTSSGATTKFSRRIIIADHPATGTVIGRKITSVVTWNSSTPPSSPTSSNCNTGSKCYYAEDLLLCANSSVCN